MKIITQPECQVWLEATFGKPVTLESVETKFAHCVTYGLPGYSGKKTVLAHAVCNYFDMPRRGLFWITCWGV